LDNSVDDAAVGGDDERCMHPSCTARAERRGTGTSWLRRLRLGEYDRVNPKKMDLHLEKKATLIWIDHGPDN
jgi:hypothetical protein